MLPLRWICQSINLLTMSNLGLCLNFWSHFSICSCENKIPVQSEGGRAV